MKLILLVALLVLSFFQVCNCWTTEDLELFDLVESTPRNFYDILGVDEKASSSEIRKAYRKISTSLHPDRNKSPNAEEEFRQVAAVADVLRNDERRKQYDLILKMGLPDWRTPIYYYRRVRNMGLFELAIFLFCFATLGQYIFAWVAYWEKKYEIEEVVLSKLRKRAKHQRKGKEAREEEEIVLSEALSILQKPKCQDLFPIRLFYFTIHVIKSFPTYLASCRDYIKTQKVIEEEEEEEDVPAPRVRTRKLVKPKIPDYADISSYEHASLSNGSTTLQNGVHENQNNVQKWDVDNLTEHQIFEFKKALKKFPVGTLQRWEKVASHLRCSVSDVTSMVKQMKNNKFSKAMSLQLQGVTGHEKENFGSLLYEEKDAKERGAGDHFRENGVTKEKCNIEVKENGCTQNGNQAEKLWKQEEQRSLEEALHKFPKDTDARWEKIAEFVSTKTKEECIERYKILVQQVKQKKGKGL